MLAQWGIDVGQRRLEPELMDQPGLDTGQHRTALVGLKRVNALSLIHRTFWPSIRELAKRHPGRELRLLDVACGGGDVAARLVQTARRKGVRLSVSGCDISPTALEFAAERAKRLGAPIHLFQFNVLKDEWPTDYDIIVNSLFLHHLSTADATNTLARLALAAHHLVLLNDLVRCYEGYWLACYAARLLSRSPIVHTDGPISVKAAFTMNELQDMAACAGLNGAIVTRCWPARMLLRWNKS